MKINAKTRKSHHYNEDRFIIGNNFYIVIDGATPLVKTGDRNLACFMVNYIKKHINKYQGRIKERLEQLSNDMFYELNIDSDDTSYLPSASLAYVEEIDDYYHVGILGDCEVTFKTYDNEIIRCFTTELTKLDDISLSKQVEYAYKYNIHVIEARKYIQDILIKHRKMINKNDGYFAYTLAKDYVLNEKEFKINKELVKEIYLYSDGFSQSFQHLKIYTSHQEMFKNDLNINDEIDKIEKQAYSDPYCDKYPRFKIIDDITIIKIQNDSLF